MRLVVCALIVATACGVTADRAPAPTASPPVASTSAPSAAPTVRPNPTAGPATYTSLELAYHVDLPAGWRRSACQSSRAQGQPSGDTFTVAPIDEETFGGIGGSAHDAVAIYTAAASQTPEQLLRSGQFGITPDLTIDRVTLDGKDAFRATHTALVDLVYVVPARGRLYVITRLLRTAAGEATARSLIDSFHVLTDAELATAQATLATPSPSPARSMQDVADALARGFGQKDRNILGPVASPCLMRGVEPGDVGYTAASKVLGELERSFASGLVVTVQSGAPEVTSGGPAIVRTVWTMPGQPPKSVKLWLTADGTTWYWAGWITCVFASC